MTMAVPVNEPLLDGNERAYLNAALDSGWISGDGPFIKQFEEQFAAQVDRSHGIAVSSGSAALDVAIAALDIGPGDEVILPTLTIISCAAAIVRAGAIPVLVDCDAKTWNMDVEQLAAKITPRTRAILVVHIYGLPTNLDPVLTLAATHDLDVIEDAAEMHGQTYGGRPCGSFGTISTFSFYANKHITTGEGGMLVTDDPQLAERCRSLRNLCFQPHKRFVHEELGWNYRITNLQAALGLAQLERLSVFVDRKRQMGAHYTALLADLPVLQLPIEHTAYAHNIYWVYGIVLHDDLPYDAAMLMRRLADYQIGTRPFFWPMHEQPVFRKRDLFVGETYPVAERLARRGLYLPSGLALSSEQIEYVAGAVRELVG